MINQKQEKILIVDNNDAIREELITALNDEYSVLGVGREEKAIDVIKTNPINIVLLDIKLPDREGFDVLRQIKILDNKIIAIIITADGSKEIIIQALQLKADDYLEKPIDIKNLKTRIRSLLELRETPYNFREYPLDLDNRLDKVKEFLKRNNGKSKLYDVANKVALSAKYLSRIFKENNERSFTEFRSQIRMEYAKYLLQNTNLTIDQITSEIGYSHWSSFTRSFKKKEGCSPVLYRKIK